MTDAFIGYINRNCSSKSLAEAIIAGYSAIFESELKGLSALKSVTTPSSTTSSTTSASTSDDTSTQIVPSDLANLSADAAKETSAALTNLAAANETVANAKQAVADATTTAETETAASELQDDIENAKKAAAPAVAQLNNNAVA